MKKFLLSAALVALAASANAQDWYVIGGNVNGASWALADEGGKMTMTSEGVYEWTGTVLGDGFKINDGTWDNSDAIIGSNGDGIAADEEYYYNVGSKTENIHLAGGYTEVNNPKIVLNVNDGTIVLTGEFAGKAQYYIAGVNGVWDTPGTNPNLEAKSEDGNLYTIDIALVAAEGATEATGSFKFATANWGSEFGCEEDNAETITLENPTIEVKGSKNVAYNLPADTYTFSLNLADKKISVAKAAAINDVEMDANVAPVYYNLQGVRVNNAKDGMFIEVRGNKAAKVIL